MTQDKRTQDKREAFFKALHEAPLSYEQFQELATWASSWATESFNEGMDAARAISAKYRPVMTATHEAGVTIVEPVRGDVTPHSMNIV